MNDDSEFDAEAFLREHFEDSEYRGRLENPSYSQDFLNRSCGDQVTLDLLIVESQIREVSFDSQGCMISQAAASILCEFIQGKSIEQLKELDAHQMLALIRTPLSPRRMQCGLLAFKALKQLLYSLEESE